MDKKLHILQHSLGADEHGQGGRYRNHFVTGAGSADHPVCLALVGLGLMRLSSTSKALTGGGDCFVVTQQGIEYVALNSPAKPKLTRSQKNYRAFLSADGGFSFGEWLRLSRSAA